MKCTKCGQSTDITTKFCPHCGAKIERFYESEEFRDNLKTLISNITSNVYNLIKHIKKNTMNLKRDIDDKDLFNKLTVKLAQFFKVLKSSKLFWAIGVLCIGLTSVLLIKNMMISLNTPEKAIEKFKTALIEEDRTQIVKLLDSKDSRLIIDEDTVDSILTAIEKYPYLLTDLEAGWNQQMNDQNTGYQIINFRTETATGEYYFEVIPFYLNISCDFDNLVISLDDEELEYGDIQSSELIIGPLMPGVHTIEAIYEGDYTTLATSKTLEFLSSDNLSYGQYYWNAEFSPRYVSIESDGGEDINVIVNGVKSETFSDSLYELGPIDKDTKIQLEKEFPWGTMKTEEFVVGDENSLSINFVENEDFYQSIIHSVNQYMVNLVKAHQEGDSSILTNINNTYKEQLIDDIGIDNNDEESETMLKYNLQKISYSKFLTSFSYDEDYEVEVQFKADFEWVDEEGNQRQSEWYKGFFLGYNRNTGEWEINRDGRNYGFDIDPENVYEF